MDPRLAAAKCHHNLLEKEAIRRWIHSLLSHLMQEPLRSCSSVGRLAFQGFCFNYFDRLELSPFKREGSHYPFQKTRRPFRSSKKMSSMCLILQFQAPWHSGVAPAREKC